MIAADLVTKNNGNDYRLEDVRITGQSERRSMPAQTHLLAPGEHVPDLALTNQDGKALRLSDFRGKALLMTLFTHVARCPISVLD